jgi:hypothetical protein
LLLSLSSPIVAALAFLAAAAYAASVIALIDRLRGLVRNRS